MNFLRGAGQRAPRWVDYMALSSLWKSGPPPWELERLDLGLEYSQDELAESIRTWIERYKLVGRWQVKFANEPKRRILIF